MKVLFNNLRSKQTVFLVLIQYFTVIRGCFNMKKFYSYSLSEYSFQMFSLVYLLYSFNHSLKQLEGNLWYISIRIMIQCNKRPTGLNGHLSILAHTKSLIFPNMSNYGLLAVHMFKYLRVVENCRSCRQNRLNLAVTDINGFIVGPHDRHYLHRLYIQAQYCSFRKE